MSGINETVEVKNPALNEAIKKAFNEELKGRGLADDKANSVFVTASKGMIKARPDDYGLVIALFPVVVPGLISELDKTDARIYMDLINQLAAVTSGTFRASPVSDGGIKQKRTYSAA